MNAYLEETNEDDYEEMLNEIYGEVEVCGMTFDSGRVLRELDPTAFRCGIADEPEIWRCSECEVEHEIEEEAEECCQEEEE